MSKNFYVPILKWKRGEQIGVKNLSNTCKDKIIPLIEIPPIEWDYENECPKKNIDEHLAGVVETILTSWGVNRRFFLDIPWMDEETEDLLTGQHALEYLFEDILKNTLEGIPIIRCNDYDRYKEIVKDIVRTNPYGVCIRIKDDDLLDLDENLEQLCSYLQIDKCNVDLIIDLEYIFPNKESQNILTAKNILNEIPDISKWRSITICATSFPENTSMVDRNTVGRIERGEWTLWNNLFARKAKLQVMPNFGDYCISNPAPFELDPRLMNMSANIRYTIKDDFLIFKGISIKKGKWAQATKLCNHIIVHPDYSGNNFSWGDKYIYDCANGDCSSGNAETWRRVGTNHHLAFVVNQLSTLSVI